MSKTRRPQRPRPQRIATQTGLFRRMAAAGIGKANHRAAYDAAAAAYQPGQTLEQFTAALRGSKAASPWLAILLQMAPLIFAFLQKLFPAPETPPAA